MTEARAIDALMQHKAEVVAGTGWEGFCAAGKGFMVADETSVGYFPACVVVRFPRAVRKRVRRLVRAYEPETEIVVLLSVPMGEQVMVALGKRTPALTPEEAFLKHAVTPACPPMQPVLFPVQGRRSVAAGRSTNGGLGHSFLAI
jgi:hypothetical protein